MAEPSKVRAKGQTRPHRRTAARNDRNIWNAVATPIQRMPSPWTMPDFPSPEGAPFLASIARLQAAGLVESVVHDAATGEGRVCFTLGYLRLPKAGREPFAEPGFVATWLTADPTAIRAWVEREAALLAEGSEGADGPAAEDARRSGRR